ncbi:MAG: hypothetical protein GY760_29660 [Deltaproteobacteria bacterium]|nr:hypothetical protein [Deltaproteobacteria bacterium]
MKKIFLFVILLSIFIYIFYERVDLCPCDDLEQFDVQTDFDGDNCIVYGDLTLESYKAKDFKFTHLPDGLIVNGNLTIKGTHLKELPIGLIVKGDLDLYKTGIDNLPENLLIEGNFYSSLSFGSRGILCNEIAASVTIKGHNQGCYN